MNQYDYGMDFVDDYGEPIDRNIEKAMLKQWRNGFLWGIVVAFSPALVLFMARLLT